MQLFSRMLDFQAAEKRILIAAHFLSLRLKLKVMTIQLAIFLGLLLLSLVLEKTVGSGIKKLGNRIYENPLVRLAMSFYYILWLVPIIASLAVIS